MKQFIFTIFLAGLLVGCNTQRPITETVTMEYEDLDTMVISAPRIIEDPSIYDLPVYHESARREFDLIHTKLDLAFDWTTEQVLGKATLVLKPHFYNGRLLKLDAKNFEFHQIKSSGPEGEDLNYNYDGKELFIDLEKDYTRRDTFQIYIDYTASPAAEGGSLAISSDKGLYFINADGSQEKPQQIWTQGETQSNSRWFPTIDSPNERCTQEMYLTVQDRFETLSNGTFISSTKNSDGTRTDYWKMDLPHAPYLFMIAIGEYAVVKDQWENIPVDYYVEPEYKASAKDIFPYTTEMLSFFSDKLGVKYPWPKYSQVVVRNFVSGAMENTTAVIFGDFVQKHSRELADDNSANQVITAHEMMHHWFGDLVTCESWSNLTLNEGFANYSEYLWFEHKSGADEADHHLLNEKHGYLQSARGGVHPLIHYSYNHRDDMFDAHSYNKGGLVLHMLRNYVGDEAFFESLKLYLQRNQFSDVEADELRLAFEDVTGEDLNWFFDQWFFNQGHPVLDISTNYNPENQQVTLTIEQMQNAKEMPAVFVLPVLVDIYTKDGSIERQPIMLDKRLQTFSFPVKSEPLLVNFDSEKMLLAEKRENKTKEELIFQYYNAPKFMDRYESFQGLSYARGADVDAVFEKALEDPFWVFRLNAIQRVSLTKPGVFARLKSIALNDANPQTRAAAFDKLAHSEDPEVKEIIKKSLEKENSLLVLGSCLKALHHIEEEFALEYAKKLENDKSGQITLAVGEIYSISGDESHLDFFETRWNNLKSFEAVSFLNAYSALAMKFSPEKILEISSQLKELSIDNNTNLYLKFAAMNALNNLHEYFNQIKRFEEDNQLVAWINEIKVKENNGSLKSWYDNFPSKVRKP